jgi:uncharacterized membrane protein required for colicin V production
MDNYALDLLFFFAVVWGFYRGFSLGIISTIVSWLSYIIGAMLTMAFAPRMTLALEEAFGSSSPLMFIVGVFITFFLSILLLRRLAGMLTTTLQVIHINSANQLLGGLITAFIFSFFFSVVVWFADSVFMISPAMKTSSLSYQYMAPLRSSTINFMKKMGPNFQKFLGESNRLIQGMNGPKTRESESTNDIYDLQEKPIIRQPAGAEPTPQTPPQYQPPLPPNNNPIFSPQ